MNTLLLRYDKTVIQREKCYCGGDKEFQITLKKSVSTNRKTLTAFIDEFKKTGIETVTDLIKVEHGYPSKLLHIITHFLDGFIGIDTVFYNLIEDSHWISDETNKAIHDSPDAYWLIHVDGYSASPGKVAFVQQ